MKITFVTDTYFPQANGVATTLERLVSGLRDRDHEVDVVRPAVLACDDEGLRVPSVAMPGYPDVRVGFPMRLILQNRWWKNRPDVIYVATESFLGSSAISAARALKIPCGTGFHTNFQQYMEHYKLPLLEKAARQYLKTVHNRSDRTFVPSHDVIDQLREWGFENLELLPKGVDTKKFSPKWRSVALRQQWRVGENSVVGIYVGRIAAEKNLDLVVRSFLEIQKNVPDFRGVFVGDGPKLAQLREEHPEFIYAGKLQGEELSRWYASADLFLFPSITETFGNVTLEAMASGLSVVAYNYAAARRYISDGENGWIAPFNDDEAFVKASIRAAITNSPSLRDEARKTARRIRWKKVVKHFEKSLRSMVDENFSSSLTAV